MTAYSHRVGHGFALAMLFAAPAASAEETVVSLSPAAKEKTLDAAAARNAAAIGEPAINGAGRRIQGQIGMMMGTNGARGVFGSAIAPVGETGSIAVAFENSRFGGRR